MEEDTCMYKNNIFAMNSEDIETPAKEISTKGIYIFDTNTDTESHSILKFRLKRQGLYYSSLYIANVNNIAQGSWSWPSGFVPGGASIMVVQTCNPMSNSQA